MVPDDKKLPKYMNAKYYGYQFKSGIFTGFLESKEKAKTGEHPDLRMLILASEKKSFPAYITPTYDPDLPKLSLATSDNNAVAVGIGERVYAELLSREEFQDLDTEIQIIKTSLGEVALQPQKAITTFVLYEAKRVKV